MKVPANPSDRRNRFNFKCAVVIQERSFHCLRYLMGTLIIETRSTTVNFFNSQRISDPVEAISRHFLNQERLTPNEFHFLLAGSEYHNTKKMGNWIMDEGKLFSSILVAVVQDNVIVNRNWWWKTFSQLPGCRDLVTLSNHSVILKSKFKRNFTRRKRKRSLA